MAMKEKWITHYSSSHKILLVGEGDFSFSACLASHFQSAKNIVATCLDSEERLKEKYWSAEGNLKELKRLDCLVLHEVDVHQMNKHPILESMKFDRIVYNFPHAGHFRVHETDYILIERHQKLLSGFFSSACTMLNENGEIHVAHRDDHPYNNWEIKYLGQKAGLNLKEKVEFCEYNYLGYNNKRGGDIRSDESFPLKECFTFKFTVACEMSSNVVIVSPLGVKNDGKACEDSKSILSSLHMEKELCEIADDNDLKFSKLQVGDTENVNYANSTELLLPQDKAESSHNNVEVAHNNGEFLTLQEKVELPQNNIGDFTIMEEGLEYHMEVAMT